MTRLASANSGLSSSASRPTGNFAADRLRSHRSRWRVESHDAAHDDVLDDATSRTHACPLISRAAPTIVDTAPALLDLVATLRTPEAGRQAEFAYDSEFIGESTYFPRLCLIQVATAHLVAIIDPLAIDDLTPFWELVGDPAVRKIVHAGEQDLEPVVRLGGVEPRNIFDTQIAAGFCALPYPASLAKLVEHVTGVKLVKGLTVTQWDQRPLSRRQLAYAADDVRYLPSVAARLDASLESRGTTAWAADECRTRFTIDALAQVGEPWERVRGGGSLNGRELSVLSELAAWRDAAAREQDLPARVLVKDEVLVGLARRPPEDPKQLVNVRHLPRPVAERFGPAIVAACRAGRGAEPMIAKGRPAEPTLEDRFAADAVWAYVQAVAVSRGIDPNLIASRREAEAVAVRFRADRGADKVNPVHTANPVNAAPLLRGWRREAVGGLLLDVLRGKATLSLGWTDGVPVSRDARGR